MKHHITILLAATLAACTPCPPCAPCEDGKVFALCDAIAACSEAQTTYSSCVDTLQGTACQPELTALQACHAAAPLQCPLDMHACAGAVTALHQCTAAEAPE